MIIIRTVIKAHQDIQVEDMFFDMEEAINAALYFDNNSTPYHVEFKDLTKVGERKIYKMFLALQVRCEYYSNEFPNCRYQRIGAQDCNINECPLAD